VTILLPSEDRLSMSREYAKGIIAYAMGGRAAEEIVFGITSTGAGNDIQKATDIARKMVCQWGMSEKLGPIAWGTPDHEVFLGREWGSRETYSERILEDIDNEVKSIVMEGYETAVRILKEKRQVLDAMSDALLIRETLEASDIEAIMRGESIISPEEIEKYQERVQRERQAVLNGRVSQKATRSDKSERENREGPSTIEALPLGT
jgi:cell division protease FtsH